MRLARIAAVLLLAAACHSPTSPEDGKLPTQYGRLSGVVTIGPNCPGGQQPNGCPTPPEAFALRKILVYDAAKTHLLYTVDIDSQGLYVIDLPATATYTIDLKPNGIDHTADLPKQVQIKPNTITRVDVSIDTGIR